MSEEQMPKNHRLLKGIVITLGILIIAMLVILVVASIMKYNDQKRAEAALVEKYQQNQTIKPVNSAPFQMNLTLDAGQEILSTDSSDKAILVRIGRDGVTEKIILIDYNGKIIGTIKVN